MIFASASIIFDAMTEHSSVTANYGFSITVSLVCQFDNVHSAADADLFNSKALCQEFILYYSTTGHLYVP